MHEPNRLLHELHVAETERDKALRDLEAARVLAVELEHKLDWLTPTYQRADGAGPARHSSDGKRLALRGYLIGYPSKEPPAIYDGQGHA